MQSSQIEQTLRGMIEAERKRADAEAGAVAKSRPLLGRLKGTRKAATVRKKRPARSRRSDLVVAALGIALGFGCAAFPWYIFFNQEKFGIRAMKFSGNTEEQVGPIYLGNQAERIGAPMTVAEIPPMKLDLFATGTPSRTDDEGGSVPVVEDQPFPGDEPAFRVVHVENGRAMIADDSGLWIVQIGSLLPDNSQVARIEKQSGKWVVVTSADRVLELSAQ